MTIDDTSSRDAHVPMIDVNLGPSGDGSAFSIWKRRLGLLFDIRLPEGGDAAAFTVRGHTWQLPTAILTSVARSGVELRRDAEFILKNPVDIGGSMRAICDDRDVEIHPGDVMFMDYSRPVHTIAQADYANVTVMFTRTSGPALFRNGALHGSVLRADRPEVRLLQAHLQSLLSELGELSTRGADAAVVALLSLAAIIMDSERAGPAQSGQRLIDRIVGAIRNQIGVSSLTPDAIATELGVSRAKLYRLMEPYGGVRNLISRVRLDESLKMLADMPPDSVAVADIALRHGFNSDAQFSRAFRARFGRTPREILAMRKVNPKAQLYRAWVETRRNQADFETIDAWLQSVSD